MDLLWAAQELGFSPEETAPVLGLADGQVRRAFADFERKHRTTDSLRRPPLQPTGGEPRPERETVGV